MLLWARNTRKRNMCRTKKNRLFLRKKYTKKTKNLCIIWTMCVEVVCIFDADLNSEEENYIIAYMMRGYAEILMLVCVLLLYRQLKNSKKNNINELKKEVVLMDQQIILRRSLPLFWAGYFWGWQKNRRFDDHLKNYHYLKMFQYRGCIEKFIYNFWAFFTWIFKSSLLNLKIRPWTQNNPMRIRKTIVQFILLKII